MSVSRSVHPSAASDFANTRPKAPEAPVNNTGLAGVSVMACSL
jgi:hypothetical protein